MTLGPAARRFAPAVAFVFAAGCATPNAADLMRPGADTEADRQQQTRRFEGVQESELLAAALAVIQDQGYVVAASEASAGVVVGLKPRSVKDILRDMPRLALRAGLTLGMDREVNLGPLHEFGIVLTTRPLAAHGRSHLVRVTFYRRWHMPALAAPRILRAAEPIAAPEIYQDFFRLLNQALFTDRRAGKAAG